MEERDKKTDPRHQVHQCPLSPSPGCKSPFDAFNARENFSDALTSAIQVITSSAGDCKQQADETVRIASEGGQSVGEAINAIRLIEKSSEQIDEIIRVISEIASQTNLLALNAA